MTTAQAKRTRSSLLFLTGLAGAAGLALALEVAPAGNWKLSAEFKSGIVAPQTDFRPLTTDELQAAQTAWRYIQNNTDPNTGLVNSVDGFASTTLWDQGSYLLGLVSAQKLGVIDTVEFRDRALKFLNGLEALPLFDDRLPNKVYNTATLAMVDYENSDVAGGIGWSALDIARMLMGLDALRRHDPGFAEPVARVVSTWKLDAMVDDGVLMGARIGKDGPERVQEGRIGYEQYAARAAALFGLDTLGVARATPVMQWTRVPGVKLGADGRAFSDYGAITPVVSEPYILMALEIGLDGEARLLARRVYEAQRARFKRQGIVTAVSEDHIDQAPHFLYASVTGNGRDWAVLDEHGTRFDGLRTLSTKAAIAWSVLFDDAYADQLRDSVAALAHPNQGWHAGRYETTGQDNTALTLNTNAVILEAMHYITAGPLL